MADPIQKQSFGQAGAVLIDAASGNVTGQFCAFTVLSTAQLTSIKWGELDETRGVALSSVALPAGIVIYGQIKEINIASGTIIAYKQAN